jgi:hypothetical protein
MCGSGQKTGRQKAGQQRAHERPEYHEPGRQKQTLRNLNSGRSGGLLSPQKRRKSA